MTHHHHQGDSLRRSQEKKYKRIEWKRKSKRWLKKLLIAVAVVMAFAVALSYVFITKENDPENLEIKEKALPWSRF